MCHFFTPMKNMFRIANHITKIFNNGLGKLFLATELFLLFLLSGGDGEGSAYDTT